MSGGAAGDGDREGAHGVSDGERDRASGESEGASAGAGNGAPDDHEPPRAARAEITVAELEQWVDHGATWRALEVSDDHAVVELCTCYGEPVDVREGAAAELIDYLRSHRGD
jgi:hypothetical protein